MAILSPKNVRFELRDPNLVQARAIFVISRNIEMDFGIFTMVPRGCWFTQGLCIGVLGIHILLEHKWKQKLPKRGKREKKAKEFQICHNEL